MTFVLALCLAASSTVVPDSAPKAEDTYKQLELFARVLSHVENNYVEAVDSKQLMYGAIRGMLDTLDPHSVFMPPDVFKEMRIDTSGEVGHVGLEIARKDDQLVVVTPLDDTPAQRAGIKAGDIIVAIDGESARAMDVSRAAQKMRGPAGKKVVLTLLRDGFSAPREFVVVRDHIRVVSVEAALYGGIAHVRVKNFQERTDASLNRELAKLRGQWGRELAGVVLDLRNNPGGLLDQAVAVSDRFLIGGLTIVSTRGRTGALLAEEKSKDRDTEKPYPLVVLVNGGSASASEIVAGALQDHKRAVVIGAPTFGKGSVQTVIEMEDGSGLKLTIARYYTPKGRSIQEKGIVPDYVVGEAEGAAPKTDGLKERDLKRHFRNESEGEERAADKALDVRLPEKLKKWEATERLSDFQLKVALNYLHGLAPASKP